MLTDCRYELFKSDIMNEKFYELISHDKSNWLRDAKRRKRWRWLTNLTLRPRIKYYRCKRAFKLFISRVVARFYNNPLHLLFAVYLLILAMLFTMLISPFIEYYLGINITPGLYD